MTKLGCTSDREHFVNSAIAVQFHDIVGLVGIVMIVGSYFLLQTGRIRSDNLKYPVLNGLGALCVLYSIVFAFNLSAFLVETFWVIINVIGIVRYFVHRRRDVGGQRWKNRQN